MTKYKEYFERMVEQNKAIFADFQKLHDEYALNPQSYQEKFNKEGEKIRTLIREWENKLCMQSEKGGYGHYTASLAEKFWGEVRRQYPKIDSVGIISERFSIKKISF